MFRTIDSWIRTNLWIYRQVRKVAVILCRYFLLEEGFSFLRYVKPVTDAVALDVGSNDGTSIEMILQLHPHAEIHSFDPVRAPSKKYSQVTHHNCALSEADSTLTLFVPSIRMWEFTQYASSDQEKMTAQLIDDFNVRRDEIRFREVAVKATSIDALELIPYLIKIDVEGLEESVLRGGLKTIASRKPILLLEIQSLESYRRIRSLMNDLDYYNLAWPQKSRLKNFQLIGTYTKKRNNYLWIPKSSPVNWVFLREE